MDAKILKVIVVSKLAERLKKAYLLAREQSMIRITKESTRNVQTCRSRFSAG